MDQEYIKGKVVEVYKECNVRTFPIDCFSILKHYDLRIITYQEIKESNPTLHSAIMKFSKDAFRFRMSVYYNAMNTDGRIRFSLMHELGHFILQHDSSTPAHELEADYFASQMLSPRVAIKSENCFSSDDLHTVFGLSYAAANRTLTDFNKWNKTIPDVADKELELWLYHPKVYNLRERRKKTAAKREAEFAVKWQWITERNAFIEENFPDYYEQMFLSI